MRLIENLRLTRNKQGQHRNLDFLVVGGADGDLFAKSDAAMLRVFRTGFSSARRFVVRFSLT